MTDREKVIKALECCLSRAPGDWCPDECPYTKDGAPSCCGQDAMLADAIAQLKIITSPSNMEEPAKRILWMNSATLCMAMKDGETQEDAEDRILEQLEDAGVDLIGWDDDGTRIMTWNEASGPDVEDYEDDA